MTSGTAVAQPEPARRRGAYAKTAQRRLEIIQAAVENFASNGYTGGSLRQIARDIDVSVTSVMHHFQSKELLLEAVLEYADNRASEDLKFSPATEGVRRIVERNVEYNTGHPGLLRLLSVMSAEASDPRHPAHDWFVARYERVRGTMAEWIMADPDHGARLSPAEADRAAELILALWSGLERQWLIDSRRDMTGAMLAGIDAVLPPAKKSRVSRSVADEG